MNKQIKQITVSWGFLLLAAVICFVPVVLGADADAGSGAQQDPITHEVSVDMMLVPIFITGPDGNPVFDLKKEDFEVKANGIPAQIAQFIQFNFQQQEEVVEEVTVDDKKIKVKQTSRAVFIIIDSVFNGYFGYRRAKTIALDIVKTSSPEDMIIVMENKAGAGPRHIAGPDESRKSIVKKIGKMKLPTGKWDRNLHLSREWNPEADTDAFDVVHNAAALENLSNKAKYMEKLAYKNQVHQFSTFLSRFKYALKTIKRPKVVFLLSEGISRAAFKNLSEEPEAEQYGKFHSAFRKTEKRVNEKNESREMRLFMDLQKIVKAINEGGSILYTINPGRARHDEEAAGEMSMRYLANESGGQYIAGSNSKKIIKKLKKTTSAYYELAFLATPDMGKTIDLKITCKRDGIKVNTFRRTERRKPYYRMDPVEKKLFALNMVTGGSWSRMVGKVVRIKYRKLRSDKTGPETATMIEVPLPNKMKGRELDLFCIRIDPKTKNVNVELLTRAVKDRANLIIKEQKDTNEFFVIIEPVFTYCVYNQV
jgi:hypothetical protein